MDARREHIYYDNWSFRNVVLKFVFITVFVFIVFIPASLIKRNVSPSAEMVTPTLTPITSVLEYVIATQIDTHDHDSNPLETAKLTVQRQVKGFEFDDPSDFLLRSISSVQNEVQEETSEATQTPSEGSSSVSILEHIARSKPDSSGLSIVSTPEMSGGCSMRTKINNNGKCPSKLGKYQKPSRFILGMPPDDTEPCSRLTKEKNNGKCPDTHPSLGLGKRTDKPCKPCNEAGLDMRVDDLLACPCEDFPTKLVNPDIRTGHRCREGQKLFGGHCRKKYVEDKPLVPRIPTYLEKLQDEQARRGKCTWGTEINGRCVADKYGKPEHLLSRREIFPPDWTPKTEEDCDQYRNQGIRYDNCLRDIGHKNIGIKLIAGFLILAGASALVFFVFTSVSRALRPKVRSVNPKEGTFITDTERGTSNRNKIYGDRWTRATPVPDATRQMTESHHGDSLVACSGDGANDGWAKRFKSRRGCSQPSMVKPSDPPRLPSLQLPPTRLATVRRANGLKANSSIGWWSGEEVSRESGMGSAMHELPKFAAGNGKLGVAFVV